jgi:glycosyltransferase involved in cell wall biosynthesis
MNSINEVLELNPNRKLIVICPVRNEDWILNQFCAAASEYADHIIIADHLSQDRSIEIAQSFPKVTLVRSENRDFSEAVRRNQLLAKAREFGPENVILSIDADEFLDPRFVSGGGIDILKGLKVGTRFFFPGINLKPALQLFWRARIGAVGFVDDGSNHDETKLIHFSRIPIIQRSETFKHPDAGLLHLQYADWNRMASKTNWYRVWERINYPEKSSLMIRRRYNHMNVVPSFLLTPSPEEWGAFFGKLDIDSAIAASKASESYWWDPITLEMIQRHASLDFGNLGLSGSLKSSPNLERNRNFRSSYEIRLQGYLRFTERWEFLAGIPVFRLVLRFTDELFDRLFWRPGAG